MSFKIFGTEEFSESLGGLLKSGNQKLLEKIQLYVYPQLKENPFNGLNIKKHISQKNIIMRL